MPDVTLSAATPAVVLTSLVPEQVFVPGGLDSVLSRIRAEATAEVIDISTPSGRKRCASIALNVAKAKTFLDDMGKQLVEGWKVQAKVVDAERKKARDTLDSLKEEVRRPLTEWENAERARVADHEAAIRGFGEFISRAHMASMASGSVEAIKSLISACESEPTNRQEFTKRAEDAKAAALVQLAELLATAEQAETEAAELARLRAEEEARRQRERDEAIAAKARAEAEAKAARAAHEARLAAAAEMEARDRKAAEALAKAEQDRQEALAAARRAEWDRIAVEAAAKVQAEEAVARERAAMEALRRDEEREKERREADKEHRRAVNRSVVDAMMAEAGLTEGQARDAISAIVRGAIPHVSIRY